MIDFTQTEQKLILFTAICPLGDKRGPLFVTAEPTCATVDEVWCQREDVQAWCCYGCDRFLNPSTPRPTNPPVPTTSTSTTTIPTTTFGKRVWTWRSGSFRYRAVAFTPRGVVCHDPQFIDKGSDELVDLKVGYVH